MPNLTVYVDRELANAIRTHGVPISSVCQAALRRRVRLAERPIKPARDAATGTVVGWVDRGENGKPAA